MEETPKKKNPMVLIGLVLAFSLLALPILLNNKTEKQPESTSPNTEIVETLDPQNVKEFVVTGSKFKFDVTEIKVNKGDTVKIVFKNSEGFHDWVIDEFNAGTEVIEEGEEEVVLFVADKVGTFEYYCSVEEHREMGMVGNLIVE